MKAFGNIIWWFPFLGFVNAIAAYVFGLLFLATIIGAPIGLGLIQLGNFYLAPFGRAMIPATHLNQQTGARGVWNLIAAIFWFPFGVLLALGTALQIGILFITIIGIPLAIGMSKSFGAILNPAGKLCRPSELRDEIARRRATAMADAALGSRPPSNPTDGV